jgi:uncharacterized protein (TIGR02996 family)
MTTLASLLRAVCEDPADDFCRLVLADWLDDNGEPARAEFVRAQVRMTQLRSLITDERDNIGLGWSLPKEQASEMLRLSRCEARLLTGSVGLWSAWEGCPGTRAEFLHPHDFHEQRQADAMLRFLFRRGFVAEVRCRLADWLAHGKGIIARQPVEAVVLADREPDHEEDNLWRWYAGYEAADALPAEIARCMAPEVRTHGAFALGNEAALSALSRAAVSWARQQAGLPPLP